MQWDDTVNAGFSFGKVVEPWLPVHQNYKDVNVANQLGDKDSILNFYRQLIKARKNSEALQIGSWQTLIDYPYEHLAYVRATAKETVLIIINFSYEKNFMVDRQVATEDWRILVSNVYEADKIIELPKTLQPFEVSILSKERAVEELTERSINSASND